MGTQSISNDSKEPPQTSSSDHWDPGQTEAQIGVILLLVCFFLRYCLENLNIYLTCINTNLGVH